MTGDKQLVTLLPAPDLPKQPSGAQQAWGQLYGCAEALAIADYAAAQAGLVVVVAANTTELLHLEAELQFFCQDRINLHTFSDWETLTYDRVSPHQDIISQRIKTLYHLPQQKTGILLLTTAALMLKLPPSSFLQKHALMINTGAQLAIDQFRFNLAEAGYRNVAQVESHGEFAVRGSILDLFPMSSNVPFRVEFFDDEIETIRSFDPGTQRGIDKVEQISLLPAHEFPLNEEGIALFRKQFRNAFEAESKNCPIYREVSEGRAPAGIEYYTPLFFEDTAVLFDYIPADAQLIFADEAASAMQQFWENTEERFEQRRHDVERPVLPPADLFLSPDEVEQHLVQRRCISTQRYEIENPGKHAANLPTQTPGLYPSEARSEEPLAALKQFVDSFNGRILFVAESTGRRETMMDLLVGNQLKVKTVDSWVDFLTTDRKLCLTTAALERGLHLPLQSVAIITESQLGSGRIKRRERRRPTRDSDAIIANLADLDMGDPVVHIDNGVGRYQGLTRLTIGEHENEFLTIHYYGDDKLYVPVSALHLISRYTGSSADTAPLHKLGSEVWQKAKRRAAEKAYDVAAELLEIHARRAARKGFAFPGQSNNYEAFSNAFTFEETPDQYTAIEAVVKDLRSQQPTDRVVCGDVGFGKTEVAMRAAFVAVDAGKQVAVLVPTTLLARQHHQNFSDRFADWPVQIESISRFGTAKEQKATLEKLASGGIDIIIGTHKLLQKGIRYKNLGLVIIDEEHRFGVRHKEHMKALRSEIDIVTLTATPIPRTLNMGLAGMRDLSIIATPPQHRHAIKTFVGEWSDSQVREACERELARGGQIYFLHNEVNTIERMTRTLEEIVPNARVKFAHGQMRESDLESVMVDFYHQRFNILVSTTIIESGIDVPTANTIIINRADKLGLAQLHQLRGRVGRSHHRAYAYLITPPKGAMTADAEKRLAAIESLEDLGVGFTLATHDLEIRGAGELLGEGQSGQIQEIGFTLYSELLERAVQALKAGKLPDYDKPLAYGTEVDLGVPALLPQDYVPDVHQRLMLYKRIASAKNADELIDLKAELIDRFGLLPPQAHNLFDVTATKHRCTELGIERLQLNPGGGRIIFDPKPKVDPLTIITLIQQKPDIYRFDGKQTLRFVREFSSVEQSREFLDKLLSVLATPNT
ncbi:MAG: transcription-repair coupling factor [Granulosicoccaceae bacterium]